MASTVRMRDEAGRSGMESQWLADVDFVMTFLFVTGASQSRFSSTNKNGRKQGAGVAEAGLRKERSTSCYRQAQTSSSAGVNLRAVCRDQGPAPGGGPVGARNKGEA